MARPPPVPASRAEASANVEPRRHRPPSRAAAAAMGASGSGSQAGGQAEGQGQGQEQGQRLQAVDPASLREAAAAGSLDALLAPGVPRLEAGERIRGACMALGLSR